MITNIENIQTLHLPEPEPWHEPVAVDALLDELAATFKRFSVFPEHADTALALWVCFTWCIDSMGVSPILAISSPEKQCGKTTLLTVVSNLSARAVPSANITPAALYRSIELCQPTMIIDEADTFLKDSNELRGILNSGHTRSTAFVIRTTGENHQPAKFSTWGAKAIALIGTLPETLHDRSIVIELRRKMPGEETERLRHADIEQFSVLCRKLKRFADDSMSVLRSSRPKLPVSISDRAADNWEPLFAIAEIAGNTWKQRAFEAACKLSGRIFDAASIKTELLMDIESIFISRGYDKISSSDLIAELCNDEERPWLTYNRGRQITPRQIAKMLSEYGIHSKSIRISPTSTPKGFERKQFEDAFQRYLTPFAENNATPPQSRKTSTSGVAYVKTTGATHKPSKTGLCGTVADKKEEPDLTADEMLDWMDELEVSTPNYDDWPIAD